ncbi:MAG: hypothetical protein ACLTBD_12145 [Clostridia bacterium]
MKRQRKRAWNWMKKSSSMLGIPHPILCYDLSDEQKERAGLTDEEIYEMTDKAALAEKYQKILADKEGENFGAYDYNGKAYEKMLEEHKLKVKKKFWDKVPFGNVTLNHKFEDQEDES